MMVWLVLLLLISLRKGEKPIDAIQVWHQKFVKLLGYIAVTDNGEIEVKPAEEGTHEAPMYVGQLPS